jgi:hypothetical protein
VPTKEVIQTVGLNNNFNQKISKINKGQNLSLFLYLYDMEFSIEDLLEMFNNNDLDVEKYFNDYETWFNILKKKGLMGEVDPKNASNSENWQNEYLLWLYDNDREKYYKWMNEILADIVVEDKNVYWQGEREDLSGLFCDDRRDGPSRDTIESILGGEDVFEPYWDTTDNVYRDVIEELTKENLEILKARIVKELSGQQLSPETEEMELIASEQGHEGYWTLDAENVTRIIDSEKSMNSLLSDELADIKSDLYSIHSSSYNSAYEAEVYDSIFNKLEEYFNTEQKQWVNTPHPYKKETVVQKFKMPIHDFEGIVNDFLESNKKYGNSGTLEYFGSLIGIINEGMDCLRLWFPDYPDSRLVDKNINEIFSDYF